MSVYVVCRLLIFLLLCLCIYIYIHTHSYTHAYIYEICDYGNIEFYVMLTIRHLCFHHYIIYLLLFPYIQLHFPNTKPENFRFTKMRIVSSEWTFGKFKVAVCLFCMLIGWWERFAAKGTTS